MCSINPLVYENVLGQRSIDDLSENIEKSAEIFLENDMKEAFVWKDLYGYGSCDMEDYIVVNIDSSISNIIVEKNSSKNVPVNILESYNLPFGSLFGSAHSLFKGSFHCLVGRVVQNYSANAQK